MPTLSINHWLNLLINKIYQYVCIGYEKRLHHQNTAYRNLAKYGVCLSVYINWINFLFPFRKYLHHYHNLFSPIKIVHYVIHYFLSIAWKYPPLVKANFIVLTVFLLLFKWFFITFFAFSFLSFLFSFYFATLFYFFVYYYNIVL